MEKESTEVDKVKSERKKVRKHSNHKSDTKRKKRKGTTEGSKEVDKEDSSKKRRRSSSDSSRLKIEGIEQSRQNPWLSTISNVVFYGVLLIIFAGAVVFNFNDNPKKDFFGFRFMTVLTNSMAPTKGVDFEDGFSRGAIIILERPTPAELKKGDIITFYPSRKNTDAFLTHRIIAIDEEKKTEKEAFITTQGDANTGADIPIHGDQVVGKVIYTIPNVGLALNFVRENLVVVTIFFVVLFASLVTLRYYLSL